MQATTRGVQDSPIHPPLSVAVSSNDAWRRASEIAPIAPPRKRKSLFSLVLRPCVALGFGLAITMTLLAARNAAAAPIILSGALDGYSVQGDATDLPPDTAPDCNPGAPCPKPSAKKSVQITVPKSAKPIDIIIAPGLKEGELENENGTPKLGPPLIEEISKGAKEEKEYFLAKLKSFERDDDAVSKLESFLKGVIDDKALFELIVTYKPGELPFAIALLLVDPETGEAFSFVAVLVPEPAAALQFAVAIAALFGASQVIRRRRTPAHSLSTPRHNTPRLG